MVLVHKMIKIILKTGKKLVSCIVMDQVIRVQENNLFFIKTQNYILEGQKLSDLTLNGSFKNTSLIKPQRSWLLEGLQVPSPLFYGETTFCRLLRMFRQFTIVLTLAFYWCKILIRPTILSCKQPFQSLWKSPIKQSLLL